MVVFPTLIGEMAKREITKTDVAKRLGVCSKTLYNKLNGRVPFTWPEVLLLRQAFFPDMSSDELFRRADAE